MRLIDDTLTKLDVWDLFNSTYNDASRFTEEETKFAKRVLSGVQEKIDSQPTAFYLDSAIEQLKEKIEIAEKNVSKCMGKAGKNIGESKEEWFVRADIFHARKESYETALEILKSAANATNGKNGG